MSRYFFAPNVGVVRVDGNSAYLTWEGDIVMHDVPLPEGADKYMSAITTVGWREICSRKYNRTREEYARQRRERR